MVIYENDGVKSENVIVTHKIYSLDVKDCKDG